MAKRAETEPGSENKTNVMIRIQAVHVELENVPCTERIHDFTDLTLLELTLHNKNWLKFKVRTVLKWDTPLVFFKLCIAVVLKSEYQCAQVEINECETLIYKPLISFSQQCSLGRVQAQDCLRCSEHQLHTRMPEVVLFLRCEIKTIMTLY